LPEGIVTKLCFIGFLFSQLEGIENILLVYELPGDAKANFLTVKLLFSANSGAWSLLVQVNCSGHGTNYAKTPFL